MKIKRLSLVTALCAAVLLTSCGASNEKNAEAATMIEPSVGGAVDRADYEYAADMADSVPSAEVYEAESEVYAESFSAESGAVEGDYLSEDSTAEYKKTVRNQAQAGLLTSGEWNDNENFEFWTNLLTNRQEWSSMPARWRLNTLDRIAVTVTDGSKPLENVTVELLSGNTVIWEAVSDNNGKAYLFNNFSGNSQYAPTKITTYQGGKKLTEVEYTQGSEIEIKTQSVSYGGDILDLMFVVDTTGSMGDELMYLQTELKDIIDRVSSENQIPVRLSVNFYRDVEDTYVVRPYDFTVDIPEAIDNLSRQYAEGGGDYEEAVEQALEQAICNSTWQEGNTKLMFLILDAPPHYSTSNSEKLGTLLAQAAKQGIRIIPVASSGVDTETEFLCRTFAAATGGTYTFLTDHSGVGGSHLEPTVGYYQVEKLNDMIVRIIESYLS